MTTNQINWFNAQENQRHNLAMEGETARHNVSTEAISAQSNLIQDWFNRQQTKHLKRQDKYTKQHYQQQDQYNREHYERQDSINKAHYERSDYEEQRHNKVTEEETERSHRANEITDRAKVVYEHEHNLNVEGETRRHNYVEEDIAQYRAGLEAFGNVFKPESSSQINLNNAKVSQIGADIEETKANTVYTNMRSIKEGTEIGRNATKLIGDLVRSIILLK